MSDPHEFSEGREWEGEHGQVAGLARLLTRAELQGTITEGFRPEDYDRRVAESVLGTEMVLRRRLSRSYGGWQANLARVAFHALVNVSGRYNVQRVFEMDGHREGTPSYVTIPVAPGKGLPVLNEGQVIIQDMDERRWILRLSFDPWGKSWNIGALYLTEDEGRVYEFLSFIDRGMEEGNFYRGQKIDPFGGFLDLSKVDVADLILDQDILDEILRNVSDRVRLAPVYRKFGVPTKRGLIFSGVPGSGKTLTGKVLAVTVPCSFIWVTPKHLMELGSVSHIYQLARSISPTIVMIEDVDLFCVDRRVAEFHPLMGELLNQMDGIVENHGVITILSTNFGEMLDKAISDRPGRFDVKIEFGPLPAEAAWRLIQREMSKRAVSFDGNPASLQRTCAEMAQSNMTGAYIIETLNYAMILAIEQSRYDEVSVRVTEDDLRISCERAAAMQQGEKAVQKSINEEGLYKWGGWQRPGEEITR